MNYRGQEGKPGHCMDVRYATAIPKTPASPAYLADIGENRGLLLMHSVGNKPDGWTIDKPLVYADYYFLEALKHKSKIE